LSEHSQEVSAMAHTHWTTPDIVGDLLAEALRPAAAEPVAIHIRPELHALICRQADAAPAPRSSHGDGRLRGVPIVVDDSIPATPGYEIHRAISANRRPLDPPQTVGVLLAA
jgi:hypothetical protein